LAVKLPEPEELSGSAFDQDRLGGGRFRCGRVDPVGDQAEPGTK
jgi:hypothetical protein